MDNVSFDVREGEVLAILGENGAGKSTLMKILSGLYKPDNGSIWVDRSWFKTKELGDLEKIIITDPRYSMQLGIGMVYQHFQLVEPFTVTENITLGQEYTRGNSPLLDEEYAHQQVKTISKNFGLPINPRALVENLPVGLKQRVEILKQLYRKAELLILDEPTAVLTPTEADELFKTIRELRKRGKSIIFISHKLHEPLNLADRIVVLRKGKVVGEILPEDADEEILAEMVVGKRIQKQIERDDKQRGMRVLEVNKLSVKDKFSDQIVVEEASIDVHEREIVGIAGVQGNGQSELVESIMSLSKVENGSIWFTDHDEQMHDITKSSTLDILRYGIAYIPEDRIQRGLVLDFDIGENIWLAYYGQKNKIKKKMEDTNLFSQSDEPKSLVEKLKDKFVMPEEFISLVSQSIVDQYNVQTPSITTKIRSLSGGNQQKVVVGRELSKKPRLIIASEPTRGVDVGVMTQIHEELIDQRNEGAAVLLISSDLDEILSLSDRIAVMYEGKIVGNRPAEEFTIAEISRLMTVGSLNKKQEVAQ